MKTWINTYEKKKQINNVFFPEQFLIRMFFNEKIKTIIQNNEKPSLLDVGCGYGRNIPLFKKFTQDITCIDPVQSAIDYVSEKHSVKAHTFVPPNIDTNNLFDVVVCCNSIYYLNDTFDFPDYFQNITALLKSNAIFIVSFIGENHSILLNAEKVNEHYYLNNNAPKFSNRKGQKIFVPDDNFQFEDFELTILSNGEVQDVFDGDIRHLRIFCFQKLS